MKRAAEISEDGKYRYTLSRDWSAPGEPTRTVVFVGLNPSTADAEKDDPTIRRCVGFAKAWGYNRLVMVNLFAFRATDPADMKKSEAPIGLANPKIVMVESAKAQLTVCAWGTHGAFKDVGRNMLQYLSAPHHLGLTKNGHPKHPLYLKADCKPIRFKEITCSPPWAT
jgi:hypothetical protein